MAVLKTLTVNGVTYTVTPLVSNVQVRADAWEGSDGAYYQVVDVPGATANCKVNLQLTPEQVVEFGEQDIYFTTENNLGVVTIHAIGDKPLKDYSFQMTVTVVTDAYKDEGGNVVVGGGGSGGDGFSPVAKVTQTEEGAVITITDKSGTTTATIFNGPDGKDYILTEADKQEIAEQASQMVKVPEDGKDGTSATHSWNGTVLTVTSASGTSSADLKGAKGDKGDSVKGDKGDPGNPGADGISPTVAVSKSGKVTTVSITDKNGTKTATINDGVDGSNGSNGKDGTSVTVKSVSESTADGGSNVVTFSDGKTVTIKNGKAGTPGKTPVKGTDYFTAEDKAEMVEDVKASMDGIPSYWLTHLTAKIPSINTAMESAGRNKSAFYFYTDAHRISSANMTPAILRYLYRRTSINKTNNGGDFFEPFATGADNLATMRNYMADMRGVSNHHSVIGNHDEDNEALTSDKQLYGFYLAWEESNDVVWGGYHYYYIDNKSENTRYIYLDTGKFAVSNAEMQFVIDALTSTPEGWHIIPISHIWYDYEISALPDYVLNLLAVFDGYNARGTGSVTHNGTAVAYDFKDALGTVEFCIGGHVHADQVHYSTGGIPVIITDTDSTVRKGSAATLGTITEGCIDAVIADYDAKQIKLVRLGRGSDRTITIPSYKPVEIVNILDTADIQYNKRYSPSSESFKEDLGTISFLIPWADVFGKTVYFKGFSNITSKGGQVSAWRGVKGTTNYGFLSSTNYNIFTSPSLQNSSGVYSIVVNATTIDTSPVYSYLQVQFVLNTAGTSVSAADLANCIMTIDQPIE